MTASDVDYYRVLQVDPAAEAEVIEAAFHRLARKYHPDMHAVEGDTTARMQELNRAWAVLRDPERRAAYDRQRRLRRISLSTNLAMMPATVPAAPSLTRRRAVSRRRAMVGAMGGMLIATGGMALGSLTVQEFLQERRSLAAVPRPSLDTITALTQRAHLAVGPLGGAFRYGVTSGITHVERVDANVTLQDFIAEARFFVPYDRHEGAWDCGFLFRNTGPAAQYRLIVSSDGRYQLDLWGAPGAVTIDHNVASGVNVDLDGYNDLRLMANGEQTYFYLNGVFVATLDTSRWLMSGDVSVATALYNGDALPNRTMRYERFTVLSLDHA